MNHYIFNIQRFCLHDGPGIRTTVFFKGCPLRCRWCSNPESQDKEQELIHIERTCLKCELCIAYCNYQAMQMVDGKLTIDRGKCQICGRCVEQCPTKSLAVSGKIISVEELMKTLLHDKLHYDLSGGGVTLSGGEPLIHKSVCHDLLVLLKQQNIHTAVETSGHVNAQTFLELHPYIDLFLYDIKHISPDLHKKATGQNNRLILDNLKLLVSFGSTIIIRYPFIPGFNSDSETLISLAQLLNNFGLGEVDILPYHRLGSEKYFNLGQSYKMGSILPPEKGVLLESKKLLLKNGIRNVTIY